MDGQYRPKLRLWIENLLYHQRQSLKEKIEKQPSKTVTRLAVNELIPFEQIEPFKRLAIAIENDIIKSLK